MKSIYCICMLIVKFLLLIIFVVKLKKNVLVWLLRLWLNHGDEDDFVLSKSVWLPVKLQENKPLLNSSLLVCVLVWRVINFYDDWCVWHVNTMSVFQTILQNAFTFALLAVHIRIISFFALTANLRKISVFPFLSRSIMTKNCKFVLCCPNKKCSYVIFLCIINKQWEVVLEQLTSHIECRPTTDTLVAYDNSTWHAINTRYIASTKETSFLCINEIFYVLTLYLCKWQGKFACHTRSNRIQQSSVTVKG